MIKEFECPYCKNVIKRRANKDHFKKFHENEDYKKYLLLISTGVDYPIKTCLCGCGGFIYPDTNRLTLSDFVSGHNSRNKECKTKIKCTICNTILSLSFNKIKNHWDKNHFKDFLFEEYILFLKTGSKIPTFFCKCECGTPIFPDLRYFEFRKFAPYHHNNNEVKCIICEENILLQTMRKHFFSKHKNENKKFYKQKMLNNYEKRYCKCGCLEELELGWGGEFYEYKSNHQPKDWNKIHSKLKEGYASGRTVVWNKGLDISDPRIKLHAENWKKRYEENEKLGLHEGFKRKASERAKKRIKEGKHSFKMRSNLEINFEKFLNDLGLRYEIQFPMEIKHRTRFYDFRIKGTNILIEIDGDYYHQNPRRFPKLENSKWQKQVYAGDKFKNELAEANEFLLLRFWEYDINNQTDVFRDKIELLKTMTSG